MNHDNYLGSENERHKVAFHFMQGEKAFRHKKLHYRERGKLSLNLTSEELSLSTSTSTVIAKT